MTTETKSPPQIAEEIVRDAASEALGNVDDFVERIGTGINNKLTYGSACHDLVKRAWGTEIDRAENYLAEMHGDNIYDGCEDYNNVAARLAWAILKTLCDVKKDAAWEDWQAFHDNHNQLLEDCQVEKAT